METMHYEEKIKEVVTIFNNAKSLEAAIDELVCKGINLAYISVMGKDEILKSSLNKTTLTIEDLADNPNTPREAYIADENIGAAQGGIIGGLAYIATLATAGIFIASGANLNSVITAATLAGGTSSALGALIAMVVGEHHRDEVQRQLDMGGLLLWVKTNHNEELIRSILNKYGGRNTHPIEYKVNDLQNAL